MAATADLINATDATITGWGGSAVNVTARTISVAATATEAQQLLGAQVANAAVMMPSSTNASRAQVAGALIDSIVTSVDLSTPIKREAMRLKRGLQELYDILAQIGA